MSRIPEHLKRLHAAAGRVGRVVAFMEVCGTHTVAAFRTGLRSLLPENVKLISGPGCPVCVTAQGDIDLMIDAADLDAVICTYGDMLKVPGTRGSLEAARARGAKVRVIYSTLDAVKQAATDPGSQYVLAAVGFETTTPATAVAIREAARLGLKNFTVLQSHKVLLPALRELLGAQIKRSEGGATIDVVSQSQIAPHSAEADASLIASSQSKFKSHNSGIPISGFLCPGHASIILGSEAFREIVEDYAMPCVVAGFELEQMLAGLARLTEMCADGRPGLDNVYPQVVKPQGNQIAQRMIDEVFEPAAATWRALGAIEGSGLAIREKYQRFDATRRFGLVAMDAPEPPGCRCGEVITGRCEPVDCALFAGRCTPITPVGPCMVSSEGSCAAWFKYGGKAESRKHKAEMGRHEGCATFDAIPTSQIENRKSKISPGVSP